MHIESVELKNFRSFGSKPTKVELGPDITALIGANGAGKSAFIEALRRLFDIAPGARKLTLSDVHFGPNETPESVRSRQIVIDVIFAFPELDGKGADAVLTVPPIFRAMTAGGPGKPLKARIRLEAEWVHAESAVDEIETKTYWVTDLGDVEFGSEGSAMLDKMPLAAVDRNRIKLVHVPATRDGAAVTKTALSQLLTRLERSGDFDATTEKEFKDASKEVQDKLDELPAMGWVTKTLKKHWGVLHKEPHLTSPRLVALSQEFTELINSLSPELSPTPHGRPRKLAELSEGQTSLFFLALSATLAELELALAAKPTPKGFVDSDINPPALTIYAIEEPENHLAPFYLSRLMKLLEGLCAGNQATGILTSHAPSSLRRLDPKQIRHFRLDPKKFVSRVNSIRMPAGDAEANKFVREAVLAQPEIYFARLVILGEGDSEQIVIPRIAKAWDVNLDPSFVAFAPLGGRHVNHFWRLLHGLGIPTLTLLDYDLGRKYAGPLRLKYAIEQLEAVGIKPPDWSAGNDLEDTAYWRGLDQAALSKWRKWLRKRGVFFSYPLDLDLMMLRKFPQQYGVVPVPQGVDADAVKKSVFGQGRGLLDYANRTNLGTVPTAVELYAYDQSFKKRDKPGSHIEALSKLTDGALQAGSPDIIDWLVEAAKEELGDREED